MLKYLVRFFPQLIILMTLSPVVNAFSFGKIPQMYDYIVYIVIAVTAFWYYIAHYKTIWKDNKWLALFYDVLIAYVIIGYLKNHFVPSGLFPFFKMRICAAFLAFGCTFMFMYEPNLIKRVVHLWWKIVPLTFLLTFWKVEISQYIILMHFCLLFLIFLPYFSKKRKMIIISALLFIVYSGLQQRIDFLNIAFPVLLYIILRIGKKWSKSFYKAFFHVLMLVPIFFLLCFLKTGFNVLDMNSYIHDDIKSKTAGNMTDDTRSLLYEEAYVSAVDNHYLWLGRTPYYGYDSPWVEQRDGDALIYKGVAQRVSEVFIVNMLTWAGLFGCVLFFLMYYKIGIDTLARTRNNALSILCLYISVFWVICWISHYMFVPSLDYMILYMVIALCLNHNNRELDNQQMETTLKKILN